MPGSRIPSNSRSTSNSRNSRQASEGIVFSDDARLNAAMQKCIPIDVSGDYSSIIGLKNNARLTVKEQMEAIARKDKLKDIMLTMVSEFAAEAKSIRDNHRRAPKNNLAVYEKKYNEILEKHREVMPMFKHDRTAFTRFITDIAARINRNIPRLNRHELDTINTLIPPIEPNMPEDNVSVTSDVPTDNLSTISEVSSDDNDMTPEVSTMVEQATFMENNYEDKGIGTDDINHLEQATSTDRQTSQDVQTQTMDDAEQEKNRLIIEQQEEIYRLNIEKEEQAERSKIQQDFIVANDRHKLNITEAKLHDATERADRSKMELDEVTVRDQLKLDEVTARAEIAIARAEEESDAARYQAHQAEIALNLDAETIARLQLEKEEQTAIAAIHQHIISEKDRLIIEQQEKIYRLNIEKEEQAERSKIQQNFIVANDRHKLNITEAKLHDATERAEHSKMKLDEVTVRDQLKLDEVTARAETAIARAEAESNAARHQAHQAEIALNLDAETIARLQLEKAEQTAIAAIHQRFIAESDQIKIATLQAQLHDATNQTKHAEIELAEVTARANLSETDRDAETARADRAERERNEAIRQAHQAQADRDAETARTNHAEAGRDAATDRAEQAETKIARLQLELNTARRLAEEERASAEAALREASNRTTQVETERDNALAECETLLQNGEDLIALIRTTTARIKAQAAQTTNRRAQISSMNGGQALQTTNRDQAPLVFSEINTQVDDIERKIVEIRRLRVNR